MEEEEIIGPICKGCHKRIDVVNSNTMMWERSPKTTGHSYVYYCNGYCKKKADKRSSCLLIQVVEEQALKVEENRRAQCFINLCNNYD